MCDPSRSAIEGAINEYVLHERDRGIMRRKMIDHVTHERIAEEFDVSPRTVGNVVRRWGPALRARL